MDRDRELCTKATKGTPYYRLQHRRATFDGVIALRVEGVSISSISVLPQSSVGGRRVTCSCARVSPDFERRSSFVDAGWAEFWHRTGCAFYLFIRAHG